MGSPIAQVAQPMTQQSQQSGKGNAPVQQSNSAGKGFAQQTPEQVAVPDGTSGAQPQGKGSPTQATNFAQPNRVTYPGQGGQPQMGQPNNYSNTVGGWDNASIQPRQTQSGKGKGY